MARFREFLNQSDGEDIARTLGKLPPTHAGLVRGWTWKFHPGNTLAGDDKHVGYMDDRSKEIAVSGPWHHSREFTALHEIAHRVWEKLSADIRKQWYELVGRTRLRQVQEPEELFCHAYANAYVKHPEVTHYHQEWMEFIRGLPS